MRYLAALIVTLLLAGCTTPATTPTDSPTGTPGTTAATPPATDATPGLVEVLAEGDGDPIEGAGAFEATFKMWTDKFDGSPLGNKDGVTVVVPTDGAPIPGLVELAKGLKANGKKRATLKAQELFPPEMLPRAGLTADQVLFVEVSVAKVFPAEKLETKTVTQGKGDKAVEKGSQVRMHYTGWTDGFDGKKKFDSSYDRGTPIALEVGAGQVIPGWDQGLVGMKAGEVRQLKIPHYLAYGNRERPNIPQYSTLFFKVELVEFVEPGELQSKTTKEGKGQAAKTGDKVQVNYTGWLDGFDGKNEFDSSRKPGRQPFEFVLGRGQVIQGWDQGVVGMKPGEVRLLTIPYNLAYGEEGRPPNIPPFSTLYFNVEYLGPAPEKTPTPAPPATPAPKETP